MSDLVWVSIGFVLVYGSMAGYLVSLDARRERARKRAGAAR